MQECLFLVCFNGYGFPITPLFFESARRKGHYPYRANLFLLLEGMTMATVLRSLSNRVILQVWSLNVLSATTG